MLKGLRHKVRMIGYYSAPRPRTAWTRAVDIAMMATLVLALPMTWMCDAMIVRQSTAMFHHGQLQRGSDGVMRAVVFSVDRSRPADVDATVLGTFQISVDDRVHGWPLTTTIRQQPARLQLDLREDVQARDNVQLAADDPVRAAITRALQDDQQNDVIEAWALPTESPRAGYGEQVRRMWIAWPLSAGLWWIVLMFVSYGAIQFVRFGWLVVMSKQMARRARLQAEGKCITCGYDMTGLEFNERCPECGEMVW